MKIKNQPFLLCILGLSTLGIICLLMTLQLNKASHLSGEMQLHQKALIKLNSYQVAATNHILLSVYLIRTGDISRDRIIAYRLCELEDLFAISDELRPEFEMLQEIGKQLSKS